MRKGKIFRIGRVVGALSFALAMIFTNVGTDFQNVYAGYSEYVATIKEDADAIDDAMWTIPNDDISVQKGKLIFSAESTADTRIILKSAVQKADKSPVLFNLKCKLNLQSIADGERFVVGLGLDSVESYIEEADSIEIFFIKNNGLQVGVRSYDGSGVATELVAAKNVGSSLGKDMTLDITVSQDMKLSVQINKKSICNQVSPINLEGRIMLAQSGGCEAKVSNLNMLSYSYDRPANSNYFEDFEKGTINTELLESRLGFGIGINAKSSAAIEEYNGNNVFMFRRASSCYFGTVQEYSNFELTFDMPYYLYKDVLREDGSIQTYAQGAFVLGIGCPAAANEEFVYMHGAEALVIEPGVVYNYLTQPTYRKDFNSEVYGDVENNVGYSVKVRLVDTILTVSLKSRETGQYDEMLSYKVGTANPLGRIYISTGTCLECAIDNWKITNLDEQGNVVTTGETIFTAPTEDWVYEEYDAPYYTETEETVEQTPSWYLPVAVVVGVGILFLLTAVIISVIRKIPKKKKEVELNEV